MKAWQNVVMRDRETVSDYAARVTKLAGEVNVDTNTTSIPLGEKLLTTIQSDLFPFLGNIGIMNTTFADAYQACILAEQKLVAQRQQAASYAEKRKLVTKEETPTAVVRATKKTRGQSKRKAAVGAKEAWRRSLKFIRRIFVNLSDHR